MVLEKPSSQNIVNLVAHIVWESSVNDKDKPKYLNELVETVKQYEPQVTLNTFAFHEKMLPYSPTTLKKDENRMAKQHEGFVQVVDGNIHEI